MNVPKVLTKFAISQHLYRGLVITIGVLIPCLLLEHYGLFGKMIALPTGTLMVSLTDNPGPQKRRLNTLLISLAIYLFVAITTSYLRHFQGIVFLLLIVYGLFFSLIGVLGNRASVVGTMALVIFTFNLDDHLSQGQYLLSALYFFLGGLWYLVIFFALDWLKPYLVVEQLMSEYLYEIGKYLNLKSQFYHHDPDMDLINQKMLTSQTLIKNQQDELREILFKTRVMVKESTRKGRALMAIFLDSIDLFERIMTTQYDYQHLQKIQPSTHIVPYFGAFIARLSHELEKLALSLPLEKRLPKNEDLQSEYQKCEDFFFKLRSEHLTTESINDFIMLRQILNSLKDLTNRVLTLQNAANFNREISSTKDNRITENIYKFIPTDTYSWHLLKDNISLKSAGFRHAIRVTIALLLGYIVALFFPVGHVYWLLLTIVVLLKPAYSLSKQRNIYRLIGTLLGIGIGFTFIHFIHHETALFILLAVFMTLGYAMLKINYMIATLGITVFIMLAYAFLNPKGVDGVIMDRIVDTGLACVIAWLTSYFVLPVWEESQVDLYMKNTLESNYEYFETVSQLLVSDKYNDENFRLARKNAFIQLGNLSDLFQRMMTEPKNKQQKLASLHQFVSTSHILTSYTASLSYYTHTYKHQFDSNAIRKSIKQIEEDFTKTLHLLQYREEQYRISSAPILPSNTELQELLSLRKKEIETSGTQEYTTAIGQKLSDLNALHSLLELINSNLYDQNRIIYKLIKS
ncbi:MAG: FUSC family protein [Pseudopedobacter saltans]|uniref:FUSC family protein n=1 Tax=Pseudopedobacter saltans TaxID=151895 RepID=A0A2W5FCS9_9SPHI|nr:MAG: FUSC family protein [Pseudopedobacter saltans]